MLYRVIRDRNIALYPFDLDRGTGLTLENLVNGLSWVRNGEFVSEEQKRLYKLSIFYIMLFLCAEVGLNNEPIKLFWERIGVRKTLDRIIYALEKWEVLVHRGPFIEMALMTLHQTDDDFSRGVFFDSLQGLYLPYVDLFITADQHFVGMREKLGDHPNARKVFRLSELRFTYHKRENPVRESFIVT